MNDALISGAIAFVTCLLLCEVSDYLASRNAHRSAVLCSLLAAVMAAALSPLF